MLTSGAFEERRTSEGRLLGLRILFIGCFAALAVAFWLLQIVRGSEFRERAANNYIKTLPLRAPRGVVFDRHGHVLVENHHSFTIAIIREQTSDVAETVRRIAAVTGADEAAMHAAVERRLREPRFRPLPVIQHATLPQVAAVMARHRELTGVEVQQVPTRTYPSDGMAAHLFGYVGEVQDAQLSTAEFSELQPGAIIGQAGLERIYNRYLMGTDGNRFVVVNSVGREIEVQREQPPVDGERLQLTIDYDLQRALEDGFKSAGFNGAAAILEPKTGEVLAMTSLPAYDPNTFATGIDGRTWSKLLTDPLKPMQNRLIQGTYSPGSTFKIVTAVAGLEEGVITPETRFYCPGYGTFYGRAFKCHRASGHGSVDVRRALEASCNVFFYNVGDRLKIDTIYKYGKQLGLVGKTGIDLPNESDSLVPSTEWKQRLFKQPWYPGETISVAIGQGAVSVTPLALATMISTVANGGTLVTPHLGRAVDSGDGAGWKMLAQPKPKSELHIKPENLQAVREGLWMAVNAAGTAGRAKVAGRDVSGKTGTAQVVSLQNKSLAASRGMDVRDNGWFVFFAPRDNPQIAGVIFAEHGLHGSSAAPIAKHVMETFFAKQDGLPLPPSPLTLPGASPAPAPVNQSLPAIRAASAGGGSPAAAGDAATPSATTPATAATPTRAPAARAVSTPGGQASAAAADAVRTSAPGGRP
jgi:penicillin-binding protein 2